VDPRDKPEDDDSGTQRRNTAQERGIGFSVLIRKTMALSRGEFEASLAALGGEPQRCDDGSVRLPLGGGTVVIVYRPLDPVRLGGLLELPRAEVTVAFEAVAEPDARAFLRRFELAFQRGGG
jgi:hypothetical protein